MDIQSNSFHIYPEYVRKSLVDLRQTLDTNLKGKEKLEKGGEKKEGKEEVLKEHLPVSFSLYSCSGDFKKTVWTIITNRFRLNTVIAF